MGSEAAQRHWEKAIRGVARRVNLAAWLEKFAPGFFWVCVAAGFGAYGMRRVRWDAAVWAGWWWAGLAVALGVCGVVAWRRSRPRFFTMAAARAWLEHRLGLDSGLSAATAGVAKWPVPRGLPPLFSWRGNTTAGLVLAGVVLAAAGAMLPVPAREVLDYRRATEKPPALSQAEEWLEKLAEEAVAREEDVEKLVEQARGLGERTPEERYSHSALEAADTLRAQTAQAIRGLGANLEEAAAALEAAERPMGRGDAEMGAVAARLGEALRGLREGALGANPELMQKLGEAANAAGRKSLSPEQAAKLREQLAKAGRAATGVLGAAGQGAEVATADPNRPVKAGGGKCGGTCTAAEGGEPCDGSCEGGSGGVARGPGHAPMMFRDVASDAGQGRIEAAGSDDLSRAALGELLGMERGEHEFDPKADGGPTAAGAVAGPAQGGEVVWVERLTPKERAALKEFFK